MIMDADFFPIVLDQTCYAITNGYFPSPLKKTKAIISYNVKSPMQRYPDYNR
jgi:hypothetical protein